MARQIAFTFEAAMPSPSYGHSDVTTLSVEVDDPLVFIPLLEVSNRQARQLCLRRPQPRRSDRIV